MHLKVHGTIFSPWVRRLIALIEENGETFELINVIPLGAPDADFLAMSPLGKVPVLEVNGRHMPDSLAASVYLDAVLPGPSVFPEDPWRRGWMLWLCDFLGTGVFSKVEAPLFIERFINPNMLGKATDPDVVDAALAQIPYHFGYLDDQLQAGASFLLGDEMCLVDLTAASIFINFLHAGEVVDGGRWPKLAAYIDRLLARPSFQRMLARERQAVGDQSPLFAA
ncbi:MAG: glutathione S-transferase family protein [Pseudomonadota bacterium]